MRKTTQYHATPVTEPAYRPKLPQDQRQVMTRSHELARAIDQYYLDCVNKKDMWGDPNEVAELIEEVYGE